MTLKAMPYENRFFLIIFGFIVLVLGIYKKNIRELLEINKQITLINKDLALVDNSSNEIYYLNNEIKSLNAIIGGNSKTPELVQLYISDEIANSNYKVNIFSIDDVHIVEDEGFNIYTNRLQIEADFNTLLKLLYDLEQNFKQSKIMSVKFFTKKNYNNKSKKLFLELILQNYESP